MYHRKPIEKPVENQVRDMPQRMVLESMNIAAEKRKQLKQLFPEVFNEDRIDFERLQRVLGEQIDTGKERYGLTWPGKAACMKVIQEPSRATLKPCREESVNFDDTENLFIEGDNLEVLKLLQKSYSGKVKMIYIDPPYNTGKEFIYPDHYQETIETYMAYAGLVDDSGKKFSTNTRTEGRFHSRWLNMMYPRLYLAKNLLRDDGVIFISIDDNEVENLRRLCNDIFGEENFMASIVWQKKYAATNDAKGFSTTHDYVIVYQKSDTFERRLLPRTAEQNKPYKYDDKDGRGLWRQDNLLVKSFSKTGVYPVTNPNTEQAFYPQQGSSWRASQETMQKWLAENRIYFGKDGKGAPQLKRYLNEIQQGRVPMTWWAFEEAGHNDAAHRQLKELFGQKPPFDTPKPTTLIELMLNIACKPNEKNIVLDFFAGSSTTAHAVMQRNAITGGNHEFIMVQLPEPCADGTTAKAAGYQDIAEISKERIRRAAKQIRKECDHGMDAGFRVFKLDKSHFSPWQSEIEPGHVRQLQANLELHISHISEEAEQEALLYELLLKAGFKLTESIEQKPFGNQTVFSIAGGTLLICLEDRIELETIEAMVAAEPAQMIVKDSAFAGNDPLKVNAVQTVKAYNHSSETDIVFKVV